MLYTLRTLHSTTTNNKLRSFIDALPAGSLRERAEILEKALIFRNQSLYITHRHGEIRLPQDLPVMKRAEHILDDAQAFVADLKTLADAA